MIQMEVKTKKYSWDFNDANGGKKQRNRAGLRTYRR